MKTNIARITFLLLAAVMMYNSIKIINYYDDAKDSKVDIPEIPATIVPQPTKPEEKEDPVPECVMIPEYMELYERNPEMVGTISIPDTNIDYPIMYSFDDPDFYLNHDFDKNENSHGSIFLGKDTSIDSSAIILYGHYMKDGTMFADLYKFLDEEFFNVHQYLEIHSLYEMKNYQVIAVFKDYVHTASDESFKFYNYYGEPEEEQFDEFKEFLMTHSIYTRDLEFLTYKDTVAQLVTCSYHVDNGRLVVVCKEV